MNFGISQKLKSKAKIEKEKETVKPTVINDALIRYACTPSPQMNLINLINIETTL